MQDDDIDRLLATAAERPPKPSATLMERVLADALAQQPRPAAVRHVPKPLPKASLFSRIAAAFGGTPTLAGLCSAAVVGIAVGYLSPSTLDYLTGTIAGDTETVELFPETEFLQTEG